MKLPTRTALQIFPSHVWEAITDLPGIFKP